MTKFEWTPEQRAKLVPGAIVTVHWDDVGERRETVSLLVSDKVFRVHDDDGSSMTVWFTMADPESVVST